MNTISATCTSKGQATIYEMIIMSTLICTRSTRLAGFFKCYMWYIPQWINSLACARRGDFSFKDLTVENNRVREKSLNGVNLTTFMLGAIFVTYCVRNVSVFIIVCYRVINVLPKVPNYFYGNNQFRFSISMATAGKWKTNR